jgi:hypothetical protein
VVDYRTNSVQNPAIFQKLIAIAAVVLIASLATGFLLTIRKSKRQGIKINLANTKRLAINLAIPLVAGGIFILVLLSKGHYGVVAPASLIFYGLALINASPNLYEEVRYLGYCEIAVGLIAAYFSGLGLLFWAIGFGGLHVVYGAAMYRKYDA